MASNCKIISHQSALAYWLSADPQSASYAAPTRERPLQRCASTVQDLEGFNTDHPLLGGTPIHLLVPQGSFRRRSEKIISHSCTLSLPTGSFWKLKDDLFIVSPSLCFAQLGRTLSEAQLAQCASKLCSLFYTSAESRDIKKRFEALATLDLLQEYLSSVEDMRGVCRAAKSLSYATEGAASPMEIKLYLLLTLPRHLGGYGFMAPEVNYRINPGKQSNLVEQNYYVADLCWPECRLIVEYDGADYHLDASHDKRRVNALEALGWKVLCVTKAEVYDHKRFSVLAKQVASVLGVRIRSSDYWIEKSFQLRRELGLFEPQGYDAL